MTTTLLARSSGDISWWTAAAVEWIQRSFFAASKLLAAQRPAEEDLGVANVLFDVLIGIALVHLDLREVAVDALAQPLGRAPESEGMMDEMSNFIRG